MTRRKLWPWVVGTGLVLAGLAAGLWFWGPGQADPLWQEKRLTAVTQRLVATWPQALVSTAEGQYSFVWPYDFEALRAKIGQVLARRLRELATAAPQVRSAEEQTWLDLYDFTRGLGLGLGSQGRFVVVQARVKLGFDFKTGRLTGRRESPEGPLVVSLPPLGPTEVVIVDGAAGRAGFPEVGLTPAQWQNFVRLLTPVLVQMVEERGLRSEAEKNAREVFSALLKTAGLPAFELELPAQPVAPLDRN